MKNNQAIHCFVAGLVILSTTTGLVRASEHAQPLTNLLSDRAVLEAFVDHLVTNRMREAHVPGAVVTIVKDNKVMLNKGYGFANLEQRTPVDPDKTLFRIASVSKVFNAMSNRRRHGASDDLPSLRLQGLPETADRETDARTPVR